MDTRPLVLIAESNSRPARLLEELIATTLDVECVRLHRGDNRISSIEELKPAALVIDSDFGGQPCRFLRELAAVDPVLMSRTLLTTANARDPEVADAIHTLGLFGFCEKPVRGLELVQALGMCLQSTRRTQGTRRPRKTSPAPEGYTTGSKDPTARRQRDLPR